VERTPLTFARLSGLDRSGPPPPETLPGAPLRPWTIPNAIGYARLALIPVFLVLWYSGQDETGSAIVFAVVAWSDYADGIAARITRQYSRMGALLDPVVDRLLVISGMAVCWSDHLLPRWAIAVLLAREVFLLAAGRYLQSRGATLDINWLGRWGVWPTMSAVFFAMVDVGGLAEVLLYVGLGFSLGATVMYLRSGRASLRALDEQAISEA